jgi:hypothetical protein
MGRYLDIAHAVAVNENNELNELTSTPDTINDPAGPCLTADPANGGNDLAVLGTAAPASPTCRLRLRR